MRSLEEGLAIFSRLGVRSHLCLMFCLLAETYVAAGQYQKGLARADLAIATSSEIGDRWCLPRIHTVRARILRTFGQVDEAEASLQMALDIAVAQSAKARSCMWQIRWRGCGAIKASRGRRANCSPLCTIGSTKDWPLSICRRRGHC